jgi:hypothetical protein
VEARGNFGSSVAAPGASKSPKDFADGILQDTQDPMLEGAPKLPDVKDIEQGCLEQMKQDSPQYQILWSG